MSIRTRVLNLDSAGAGTVGVPPSRLVAVESEGAFNATSLGRQVIAGVDFEEILPPSMPLISGHLVVAGQADEVATVWFDLG